MADRFKVPPSLLRYVGGKTKIARDLAPMLACDEYREPFIGGGSVALAVATRYPAARLWLNDKDVAVAAFWSAIVTNPEPLARRAEAYTPTPEDWFTFKDSLLAAEPLDPGEAAFRYYVVNRCSHGGLGLKAGTPMGGKDGEGKGDILDRWIRPGELMREAHSLLAGRTQVTAADAWDVLAAPPARPDGHWGEWKVLVYLDPPYYAKGLDCYRVAFTPAAHRRLAKTLRSTKFPWLMSYDNAPEVRDLYRGMRNVTLDQLDWNYSTDGRGTNSVGADEGMKELVVRRGVGLPPEWEATRDEAGILRIMFDPDEPRGGVRIGDEVRKPRTRQ